MSEIIFVTGGARSGKSTMAETLLTQTKGELLYIATAVPFDEEMRDRIDKHKKNRQNHWQTVERYENFQELIKEEVFQEATHVLLDCLTVLLSNRFFDANLDENSELEKFNRIEKQVTEDVLDLMNLCRIHNKMLVIVSNELGMGIVPLDRMTRMYRDIAGRLNQVVAAEADKGILVVSGIGITIKG
jgi:adenosylcobinamide kinase/adenosylcobinamide-phosphate guanylyltransferase